LSVRSVSVAFVSPNRRTAVQHLNTVDNAGCLRYVYVACVVLLSSWSFLQCILGKDQWVYHLQSWFLLSGSWLSVTVTQHSALRQLKSLNMCCRTIKNRISLKVIWNGAIR